MSLSPHSETGVKRRPKDFGARQARIVVRADESMQRIGEEARAASRACPARKTRSVV